MTKRVAVKVIPRRRGTPLDATAPVFVACVLPACALLVAALVACGGAPRRPPAGLPEPEYEPAKVVPWKSPSSPLDPQHEPAPGTPVDGVPPSSPEATGAPPRSDPSAGQAGAADGRAGTAGASAPRTGAPPAPVPEHSAGTGSNQTGPGGGGQH